MRVTRYEIRDTGLVECRLCGLPVGRSGVQEQQGEIRLHFCCFGCRQVFQILSSLPEGAAADYKNSDLYRLCEANGLIGKDFADPVKNPAPRQGSDKEVGEAADPEAPLSRELIFKVEGMWCSACSWLIEAVLAKVPGIVKVKVLFASDLVQIDYLPHRVTVEDIQARISRLGYSTSLLQDPEKTAGEKKRVQLRLGLSAILTVHIMMISLALYAGFFQDLGTEAIGYLSYPLFLLTTPVLLYGGFPIFKKALNGLRFGKPTMEVLIAMGALSAYFYSLIQMARGSLHLYFDTAAMLIVLVLLGKYLESGARERISRGLVELYHLAHQKVRLLTKTGEKWLAADQVRAGDEFQVLAGERLAVDGRIISGQAGLDESFLTGESRPVKRGPHDQVRAGSLLLDHSLILRATHTGAESAIGRIITLMQDGLSGKTHFEHLADRLTGWVVPGLLLLAGATALYLVYQGRSLEEALLRSVTIMVISCPCALGIATPLAKVASIGAGRLRGILIRDPAALEKIEKLDVLIFDKTGTLTEGRYALREMVFLGRSKEEAWQKIASVEALSDHFLAREVQNKAREFSLSLGEVTGFRKLAGMGVNGEVDGCAVVIGNSRLMHSQRLDLPKAIESQAESLEARGTTVVFFGWQGRVWGLMAFGDVLKEKAHQTVASVQQNGFQTWLVSGDSPETTGAMARDLGIESFVGQAMPQEKVGIIKNLQRQGHRVGMIGDGLNDAAALAQADVGFALGTGGGLLAEASDITLLTDDPWKIREVLDLSCLTVKVIRQNLGFAFFYNMLGIPLAVTGLLNPLVAVLAMFASSLTVVGNTMRIYKKGQTLDK
ncbi:MAG: cation-translocating P-type ATPase [Deltaproteobacteria bacterium]|nr:cation-translocating P-type ATPase [Deltaproteobacteria bacterium]